MQHIFKVIIALLVAFEGVSAFILPREIEHHVARQTTLATTTSSSSSLSTTQFPLACQIVCGPFVNALNTCPDLTCLCTNANSEAILACMDCDATAWGTETETDADQGLLNQFQSECASIGIDFTSMVVSTSGAAAPTASTTIPVATTSSTLSFTLSSASATKPVVGGSSSVAGATSSPSKLPGLSGAGQSVKFGAVGWVCSALIAVGVSIALML